MSTKDTDFEAFMVAWRSFPSQDNEGYVPDRGGFKAGWFAALEYERTKVPAIPNRDNAPEVFRTEDFDHYDDSEGLARYANRILAERGMVVYGHWDGERFRVPDPRLGLRSGTENPDTHRALLVGIEPIRKETAEDLLREVLRNYDDDRVASDRIVTPEFIDRARRLLGDRDTKI